MPGAASGTTVPTSLNLTNVAAIACGWGFNLALSSNGTVTAWGTNLYSVTNVPSDLITNVAAIAAGSYNALALRKTGTVEAWGQTNGGVTNVPVGLSNVVAIATGGNAGLALQGNGNVVAWGRCLRRIIRVDQYSNRHEWPQSDLGGISTQSCH